MLAGRNHYRQIVSRRVQVLMATALMLHDKNQLHDRGPTLRTPPPLEPVGRLGHADVLVGTVCTQVDLMLRQNERQGVHRYDIALPDGKST